jgi:hypothetical protein
MIRLATVFVISVTALFLLHSRPANAQEKSSPLDRLGESVPLTESDLDQITAHVLRNNPLLSSSPGIKFADAQRSVRSTDIADVIFYPHLDSAGMKYAFQVGCWRTEPDPDWTCNPAEIRRYLRLDSQEFEVRISADIRAEDALALIQATREALSAGTPDGSYVSQTAIQVLQRKEGFLVSWGTPQGFQEVMLVARLADGGDPGNADDWQAGFYEYGRK